MLHCNHIKQPCTIVFVHTKKAQNKLRISQLPTFLSVSRIHSVFEQHKREVDYTDNNNILEWFWLFTHDDLFFQLSHCYTYEYHNEIEYVDLKNEWRYLLTSWIDFSVLRRATYSTVTRKSKLPWYHIWVEATPIAKHEIKEKDSKTPISLQPKQNPIMWLNTQ